MQPVNECVGPAWAIPVETGSGGRRPGRPKTARGIPNLLAQQDRYSDSTATPRPLGQFDLHVYTCREVELH
jgi:hypothetical protein